MLSTEKKPSSFIINTLLFFRTLGMIAESIYGFLPYEQSTTINDTEVKGDGEKLWQILLGSQPPTFKINLYAAAIGVMSAPLIIGVMKGLYKELRRLKSEISNPPLSTANRPPTFCSSKRPH